MKIGVFIGGATYIDVVDKIAVTAEKLGFDSFFLGDHMFLARAEHLLLEMFSPKVALKSVREFGRKVLPHI